MFEAKIAARTMTKKRETDAFDPLSQSDAGKAGEMVIGVKTGGAWPHMKSQGKLVLPSCRAGDRCRLGEKPASHRTPSQGTTQISPDEKRGKGTGTVGKGKGIFISHRSTIK